MSAIAPVRSAPPSDATIPVVAEGFQVELPGMLWPAGLRIGEPIHCGPMPLADANRYCELWEHPLGRSRRPFHQEAHGMAVNGTCVAVVIAASTISATVEKIPRPELVDLARIARHPKHDGAIRAMLRLWRDYLAQEVRLGPDWQDTAPKVAVSYALPGKAGNVYRFDGWIPLGARKPWGGGATWSGPSVANGIADGVKSLWAYAYDAEQRRRLQALSRQRKQQRETKRCS
jgi:hypothetical protein